jgi:hypothetical protein
VITPGEQVQWWIGRVMAVGVLVTTLGFAVRGAQHRFVERVAGSPAAADQPPCPEGRTVPVMPSPHISQVKAATVRYNSLPPASGPHFGFVIATGVYRDPVPEALAVHAMEHGHVIIWYARGTAQTDVAALEDMARRYPSTVILTPYPKLAAGIAVTSWGCVDMLASVDRPRIDSLVGALRDRYDHGWTVPAG